MTAEPDYATPPGEFIAEWMEENSVDADEFARRLGVTREHLATLLNGDAPVSPDLLLAFERATGVPARIWSQYQTLYQRDSERLAAATTTTRPAQDIARVTQDGDY